jgi:phage-related tail fiber protein
MAKKATLRVYRGLKAGLPTLLEGEPALTQDTNEVYIGTSTNPVRLLTESDLEKQNPKQSVVACSTGNLTLSGIQVIDGVTLVDGDRVLVINQTNLAENGIYLMKAGAWIRSLDANDSAKLQSAYVYVSKGATNADRSFLQVSDDVVVGTSDIIFTVATSDVDGGVW